MLPSYMIHTNWTLFLYSCWRVDKRTPLKSYPPWRRWRILTWNFILSPPDAHHSLLGGISVMPFFTERLWCFSLPTLLLLSCPSSFHALVKKGLPSNGCVHLCRSIWACQEKHTVGLLSPASSLPLNNHPASKQTTCIYEWAQMTVLTDPNDRLSIAESAQRLFSCCLSGKTKRCFRSGQKYV